VVEGSDSFAALWAAQAEEEDPSGKAQGSTGHQWITQG